MLERQREIRKSTRFTAIPLVLLAIVGLVWILAGQFTKEGSEMPVVLDGKKDGTVQVSSADTESEPELEIPANKTFKILIDPGHGGKDPGAEGYSGVFETVSNLGIAKKLYDILRNDAEFEVRLTREDDTFVELEDRSAMANDWKADAMVSIHGNAYEDRRVSGSETFYRYDNGLPLAEAIHAELVKAMGFKDRGIRLNDLKVLTLSQVPAILIESGYLSNPGEEAVLLSEEGQTRMARAIADGLKEYASQVAQASVIGLP